MSDLIDRQAAIDHWRSIIDATDGGDRYDMGFVDGLEFCISDLSTMPSAQPTLYGYEIEHLAYIATVMQKEGVTAEYAVRTFGDMSRALRMIIEELQEKVEKSLSAMQLPFAQPEIVRCKNCKHWMPYDWMFSEVWQSKNMDDYPEKEIGCAYCDMNMGANDFCSYAERRETT